MELEGIKMSLKELHDADIPIKSLVTDRHSSVKRFMREKEPSIDHWFDVWHVAKGMLFMWWTKEAILIRTLNARNTSLINLSYHFENIYVSFKSVCQTETYCLL